MSFTADDLKRLKELVNPNSPDELERLGSALLARLEAAEDVCKFHHCHCEDCDYSRLNWRKAKGEL